MNKILVTASASRIRESARVSLNGKWGISFLAFFIVLFIIDVPVIFYNMLFNYHKPVGEVLDIAHQPGSMDHLSLAGSAYAFFLSAAFILGFAMMMLSIVRKKHISSFDPFDGFEYFFKALGLYAMITIFILLWSLLFIIPGVFAALRYSQAFFILADEPDLEIMECIEKSKKMMRQNQSKLFLLDLSIIGWMLLSFIPAIAATAITNYYYLSDTFLGSLILFVAMIPVILPTIYMAASNATFYELLQGKFLYDTGVDADYEVV